MYSFNSTESVNTELHVYDLRTFRYFLVVFLVVLATSGIVGNACIYVIYASRINKARRNERLFLLVLAVVDFFGCIFHGLFHILRNLEYEFPCLSVWCFLKFAVYFTVGSSGIILLCIAIHRYRKICQPFRKQPTIFWRRICLIISFGISFVFSLLKGVRKHSYFLNSEKYRNGTISKTTKYYCVSVFFNHSTDTVLEGIGMLTILLLGIITVGLYIPVIYHTRKMFQKNKTLKGVEGPTETKAEKNNAENSPGSCNQSEKIHHSRSNDEWDDIGMKKNTGTYSKREEKTLGRLNKLCFVIAFVNFVSYLPYIVFICISLLNVNLVSSVDSMRFKLFAQCMPIFQQAVNPYINIGLDLQVKRVISKCFSGCCQMSRKYVNQHDRSVGSIT